MLTQTQPQTTAKPMPANTQVFTYRSKGKYSAEILGHDVLLIRVRHNLWQVIAEKTQKVFAEGETRQAAVREAFYDIVDAEEKRLEWVLNDQPYRVYGSKPRRTKKEIEDEEAAKKATQKPKAPKAPTKRKKASAAPKTTEKKEATQAPQTSTDSKDAKAETAKKATMKTPKLVGKQTATEDDRYSFTYNETLGGHIWMHRDSQGKIDVVHGPFSDEDSMLQDLMSYKLSQGDASDNATAAQ